MIKRALKNLAIEAAIPLVRVLDEARTRLYQRKIRAQCAEFSSCGEEVLIAPSVAITQPKAVAIGNNVHIGADTYIMSEGGLQIGDNVHISRRVTIYCSDHDFRNGQALPYGPQRVWKQVLIKRNVWIGMNACILPGVTIGEGAIVGMGAVVAKDVAPLAIVGQQPFRLIGQRDGEDYAHAEQERYYGGRNGAIVPPERQANFRGPGIEARPSMCFVLTTGRSGSTTISDYLNAHPQICARHEPRRQIIKWSTDFAHGTIDRNQARQLLAELFLEGSVYRSGVVHVESDQKYFNFIPILNELFPEAKFIWLVRSASKVIPSVVGRGWYSDESHPVSNRIGRYWHDNRIQGDQAGAVSGNEWRQMDPFEKSCWYWNYVNSIIERDLAAIPPERQLLLRLEDMARDANRVFDFIGVSATGFQAPVTNAAFYERYDPSMWSSKDRQAFARWCKPIMTKLYPERAA